MKLYKNLKEASLAREDVQALKINVKTDQFPMELFHIPNLEELYLDGSCKEFPREIPSWESLRTLSIKWPNFTGDLSALFRLPNLTNLKIIETPLKTFLLPLGHNASPIKSLTIKDCNLSFIPEEISMLTQLSEMNLSGNKLVTLPHGFVDLHFLSRLNMDNNSFVKFPELVKSMPKLIHLSFDGNQFPEEEKERIQREYHIWVN